MKLSFLLNGQPVRLDAAPDCRAVDLLRDLHVLDVKEGCGTGECGACSVLVDGAHKLSCLMLAAQLDGCAVTTATGLGSQSAPHPIQRAFAEHGAVQCGFCTPGMSVAAAALLAENPKPGREDIRRAISGNLCRCTGYVMIVDAVQAAAEAMCRDSGPLREDPQALRESAQPSRKKPQPAGKEAAPSRSVPKPLGKNAKQASRKAGKP